MKIEINTTEKYVKILEDISAKELLNLMDNIKNIEDYKILQTKEIVYTQPIQYIYDRYYINPYTPIWTTSTGTGVTITTSTNGGYYNQNTD